MEEDELINDVLVNVVSEGIQEALGVEFCCCLLMVTLSFLIDGMQGLGGRQLSFLLSLWDWKGWTNRLAILLETE